MLQAMLAEYASHRSRSKRNAVRDARSQYPDIAVPDFACAVVEKNDSAEFLPPRPVPWCKKSASMLDTSNCGTGQRLRTAWAPNAFARGSPPRREMPRTARRSVTFREGSATTRLELINMKPLPSRRHPGRHKCESASWFRPSSRRQL